MAGDGAAGEGTAGNGKAGRGKRARPDETPTYPAAQVAETLRLAGVDEERASELAQALGQAMQRRGVLPAPAALRSALDELARRELDPEVVSALAAQTASFEPLTIRTRKGKELPFSRSLLAGSLEDAGLEPRSAYALASRLEAGLRRRGLHAVSAEELADLTEARLRDEYGEGTRQTYRFVRANKGRLGVTGSSGGVPLPFSKGILMQSLLAAGLNPDYARKVARSTQRALRGSDDRVVTRRALRERVEEILDAAMGPEVAERYRLLRVVRQPPRPIIVLLGGVSGTGKSVLAAEIAYRLGITRVVSTDSIREVMRAMVSRELTPTLHASTFNAWETLIPPEQGRPEHPSERQLLAGFREQVQQVSVGLSAVVRRSLEEGTSLVLEGVHLVPGYLKDELMRGAIVVPILITLPDEAAHRQHFSSRDSETAQARPKDRYLRYFSEIRTMQGYLEGLASRRGVPVLSSLSPDDSADQAVEEVLRQVIRHLNGPGAAAAQVIEN